MGDITENFSRSEFVCKHCGKLLESDEFFEFVKKLQRTRDLACEIARTDVPFKVTSGYRCPFWNREVGGGKRSAHILALAADIEVPSSRMRYIITKAAMLNEFMRIGVGDEYLHLDDNKLEVQMVMWDYYG